MRALATLIQDMVSNPLGWEGDSIRTPTKSPRRLKVSNPLGWEGDDRLAGADAHERTVSIPLGWEGDGTTLPEGGDGKSVSNPLGWEGDPCKWLQLRPLARISMIWRSFAELLE